MDAHSEVRLVSALKTFSKIAGGIAAATGLLALLGWAFDIQSLKSVIPGLATMKANTAAAFLLAGAALFSSIDENSGRVRRIFASACAVIVALLAIFTLSEYAFGVNWGIDQLLFKDPQTPINAFPGRMSIATALNFALLGIASLLADSRGRRIFYLQQALTILAGSIASLALIGYLYDVKSLYSVKPYSSMAVHTALSFILLSLGIFCARPQRGLLRIVIADTVGGEVLRRLLPVAIGMPILLGWLSLWGQRLGYYDTTFGLVWMVVLTTVLLCIVIWWNAGQLERLDITRQQSESNLRERELSMMAISNSAMDGIISIDEDQRIIIFNPAAEKIFMRPADKVIGKPLTMLIPERLRAEHEGNVRAFGKSSATKRTMGKLGTVFGLRANGEEFPLEVSISKVDSGGRKTYTAILRDITERKQTEESLRASEARKAAVLESALDCIITMDHRGRILEFNPAAQSTFGYKLEDALGREMAELIIPPALRDQHRRGLQKYLQTGEGPVLGKRIELTGMRSNGSEFPVELSITRVKDSNPAVFTGFLRDITERKHAENALRESEERARMLIAQAADGIFISDAQGNYLDANPRGCGMLGYELAELTKLNVRDVMDPEELNIAPPRLDEVKSGKTILSERRLRRKDGSILYAEISAKMLPTGNMQAIVRDVSERKQVEERNRFLANLVSSVSDAVIATDMQQVIESWNAGAEKMYGWKAEEVLGQLSKDVLNTDFGRETREAVTAQIINEGYWSGEVLHSRRDGTKMPVLSSVSLYKDSRGKPAGIVAVNRDITERKRVEEEIRKLNEELEQRVALRTLQLESANKELEAFSYSVSHDLRAPLRSIDGFARILQEDYAPHLDSEGQRYLKVISDNTRQMGQLIDDLLTFSRVSRQSPEMKVVSLTELTRDVLVSLQPARDGRQVEVIVNDLPPCRGDPNLLKQVLVNLLGNALKFTRQRENARIEVGCSQSDGENVYFVKDNGAGFDMKYADKLFNVFQRLHRADEFEGTGVGLAIVQRIIHRHGGRVWAEAAVDQGATFYFMLPSAARAAKRPLPKEKETIEKRAKDLV